MATHSNPDTPACNTPHTLDNVAHASAPRPRPAWHERLPPPGPRRVAACARVRLVMAPFRPKRRAAEEEDEEEEELDEEDEELLAPGRAPGSDAPRPIVNVAGMSAAMEDFAWPASVAWVDTLVVQVRRLWLPAPPPQPGASSAACA